MQRILQRFFFCFKYFDHCAGFSMSYMNDVSFLNQISSRLLLFKKVSDSTWNCRCPICGDSKKDPRKARGFFFRGSDCLFFKCHNCGISKSFSGILKMIDSALYKEYLFRTMSQNPGRPQMLNKIAPLHPEIDMTTVSGCTMFDSHITTDESNLVVQFLSKRLIPRGQWHRLGWAHSIEEFYKSFPEEVHTPRISTDYTALIIPLVARGNTIPFGYQARRIDGLEPRYVTTIIDKRARRLFGYELVKLGWKHYVVEGPLDSLFLENSYAVCGSDMKDQVGNPNAVFVLDCEPRNNQIVKKYKGLIDLGAKVCMLPRHYDGLDINDLVLGGLDPKNEIIPLINANTYSGLTAQIYFETWRKV